VPRARDLTRSLERANASDSYLARANANDLARYLAYLAAEHYRAQHWSSA
jgi:hypothetical protein